MTPSTEEIAPRQVLVEAEALKRHLGQRFRDQMVESIYDDAKTITQRVVQRQGPARWALDTNLDRLVTSPIFGLPLMLLLLAVVFWITVLGANVPSSFLAGLLMQDGGLAGWCDQYLGIALPSVLAVSLLELLHGGLALVGAPAWLSGFLVDGVYLGMAWVVAVMLPPMAIFFPMFTLLEDFGYLPRVAFNLDGLFRRVGAHGKQALSMSMGFGCNAAGVIACRVIDSPRERLIAIITNAFVPCNGRFPTLIMLATVFIAAVVAPAFQSAAAALTVVGAVMLGVLLTLGVSWLLSRTALRGEPSAFTLELPPYRRPSILRVLYTSLVNRTMFVLARAVWVAAPAGGVIWLLGNISIDGSNLSHHVAATLEPLGWLMGLDGIILLAFIIAIPANEIVVPTILMTYMNMHRMIELESLDELRRVLIDQQGWGLLTAVCLIIFCVAHNPCGTTIWTIWRETRSLKWTMAATLLPVAVGMAGTIIVAGVWRLAT